MEQKIAIQGFEGSFHQAAARNFFGNDAEILGCATFREVVSASRHCRAGMMAIENSIAGSILPNYNLLQKYHLHIVGEVYLKIDQNLMALPGVSIDDIREVHSHPMALLQCGDFLERYPWKLVESEDTGLSAQLLRDQQIMHAAAVAGPLAAELFGLNILKPNIQTARNNYTRFWVLMSGEYSAPEALADKASLIFQTDHSKGSLARVLAKIADSEVNLSKLQSMPIPGSDWRYAFHADCEFSHLDQWWHMIEEIKPWTADIKIYGVYKNGKNNFQ